MMPSFYFSFVFSSSLLSSTAHRKLMVVFSTLLDAIFFCEYEFRHKQ